VRSTVRIMVSLGVACGIGLASAASASAAETPARSATVVQSTPWRAVYAARLGSPSLRAVSAISATNAWAVGNSRSGPFIVHWNGQAWHSAVIPHPAGFVAQSIQARPTGGVWVLGYVSTTTFSAFAIEWNGSTWHLVRLPADASDAGVIFGPADMWLLGETIFCNGTGTVCTTTVLHWNGQVWTRSTAPTLTADIEGTSDKDMWLIGTNNTHQVGDQEFGQLVGFRWNGRSWVSVTMPHPEISGTPTFTVDSPSNVWMSAVSAKTDSQGQQPTLGVHWNGTLWTVLTAPDVALAAGPIATDGGAGAWFTPNAHWTGRTWIVEAGLWLPSWANPFSFVGMARIPGTTIVLVVVDSQGGTLVGTSQRLP